MDITGAIRAMGGEIHPPCGLWGEATSPHEPLWGERFTPHKALWGEATTPPKTFTSTPKDLLHLSNQDHHPRVLSPLAELEDTRARARRWGKPRNSISAASGNGER